MQIKQRPECVKQLQVVAYWQNEHRMGDIIMARDAKGDKPRMGDIIMARDAKGDKPRMGDIMIKKNTEKKATQNG